MRNQRAVRTADASAETFVSVDEALAAPTGRAVFEGVAAMVAAVAWWARMACQQIPTGMVGTTEDGWGGWYGPIPLPAPPTANPLAWAHAYAQACLRAANQAEGNSAPQARADDMHGSRLTLSWWGTFTSNRWAQVEIREVDGVVYTTASWESATGKMSTWLDVPGAFEAVAGSARSWGDDGLDLEMPA